MSTADIPSSEKRLPPAPRGSSRNLLRDPLNYFLSLTREYGDIVCYRPAPEPAYLINHPDYVRHVLVDNYRNYDKSTFSNQAFKKLMGDGLITAEGEAWLKQRRLLQPAFHHLRVARLDQIVVESVQELLLEWEARLQHSEPVDIAREMAALTLTITARALFGVNLGGMVKQIGEIVNRVAGQFEKTNNPQVIQARDEFSEAVDYIIAERRRQFHDQGDLLSSMMVAKDEETGQEMSDEQLREQLMGLFLAGYETTANALTWTWYLLTQNPRAYSQMRLEVNRVLNGRLPGQADLEQLPYVRAVLEESLRIYPPAWIIGRRAIGEDEIGGFYVPPNTVIAIVIYTIHRHPSFWDRPDDFDPTRFIGSTAAARNRYAYIPFGAGPRQCIGNTFGLMEGGLILACIAQRFELRRVPGIEVKAQPLYVLRPSRDLFMSLNQPGSS